MSPACPACGYDLAGVKVPVCPECGAAVDPRPLHAEDRLGLTLLAWGIPLTLAAGSIPLAAESLVREHVPTGGADVLERAALITALVPAAMCLAALWLLAGRPPMHHAARSLTRAVIGLGAFSLCLAVAYPVKALSGGNWYYPQTPAMLRTFRLDAAALWTVRASAVLLLGLLAAFLPRPGGAPAWRRGVAVVATLIGVLAAARIVHRIDVAARTSRAGASPPPPGALNPESLAFFDLLIIASVVLFILFLWLQALRARANST